MSGRERGARWSMSGTFAAVALLAIGAPLLSQESQGDSDARPPAEEAGEAVEPRPMEARDARTEPPRLSPLDSVSAVLGQARIEVRYGRPSMRGRRIFGRLVPWGEIWRTGANEATHLRTTADLRLGETRLPAGHYTLWTVPTRDGWTLIVNEQTGQWGTQYDPQRDVARLSMRTERLRRPVETFTIGVEGTEGAEETDEGPAEATEERTDEAERAAPSRGRLWMEWERYRASVPFEVLPAESPTAAEPDPGG